MSFKLQDLKFEIENSKQEITKGYDIFKQNGLSDDRTFCFFNNDCGEHGEDINGHWESQRGGGGCTYNCTCDRVYVPDCASDWPN